MAIPTDNALISNNLRERGGEVTMGCILMFVMRMIIISVCVVTILRMNCNRENNIFVRIIYGGKRNNFNAKSIIILYIASKTWLTFVNN
jgi:hypothetical protein